MPFSTPYKPQALCLITSEPRKVLLETGASQFEPVEELLENIDAYLAAPLRDSRERRTEIGGVIVVVEAHQRNLLGDPSLLGLSSTRGRGDLVVVAEGGIDAASFAEGEQGGGGLAPAAKALARADDDSLS